MQTAQTELIISLTHFTQVVKPAARFASPFGYSCSPNCVSPGKRRVSMSADGWGSTAPLVSGCTHLGSPEGIEGTTTAPADGLGDHRVWPAI